MAINHIKGRNAGHVMLYALSTCPWCIKVKKLLHDMNIEYSFVDIDLSSGEELEKAMKAVDRWNPQRGLPLLVIDDSESVIGFNEAKIRERLEGKN